MELGQIALHHGGRVARRIARDEDGQQHIGAALALDNVNHDGHLVELLGADVGAVGEAEVDLRARSTRK